MKKSYIINYILAGAWALLLILDLTGYTELRTLNLVLPHLCLIFNNLELGIVKKDLD